MSFANWLKKFFGRKPAPKPERSTTHYCPACNSITLYDRKEDKCYSCGFNISRPGDSPTCRVKVSGDHSECKACGVVWDTNDRCLPMCWH